MSKILTDEMVKDVARKAFECPCKICQCSTREVLDAALPTILEAVAKECDAVPITGAYYGNLVRTLMHDEAMAK